jgi:hypothetical protein
MKAQLLWTGITTAAQWLFNAALYACPLVWIVVGIAAIIAVIVLMIMHWDKVKKVFFICVNFMWKWIKKIGQGIIDFLLAPLILVLKIISKISGAKWAGEMEHKITHLIPQDDDADKNDSDKKPVNPHLLAQQGQGKTQSSFVNVNVSNNNNSKIDTRSNIPIKVQTGSTYQYSH